MPPQARINLWLRLAMWAPASKQGWTSDFLLAMPSDCSAGFVLVQQCQSECVLLLPLPDMSVVWYRAINYTEGPRIFTSASTTMMQLSWLVLASMGCVSPYPEEVLHEQVAEELPSWMGLPRFRGVCSKLGPHQPESGCRQQQPTVESCSCPSPRPAAAVGPCWPACCGLQHLRPPA